MELNKLYQNKNFHKLMDLVRILMLIGVVIIIAILLSNIQEVKLLGGDACKLCSLKTGAECLMPIQTFPFLG